MFDKSGKFASLSAALAIAMVLSAGSAFAETSHHHHARNAIQSNLDESTATPVELARNAQPFCEVSREQIPVVGGGVAWKTIVSDCPMD